MRKWRKRFHDLDYEGLVVRKRTNKRKYKKNYKKAERFYRSYAFICYDSDVYKYIKSELNELHYIRNYEKPHKPNHTRVFAVTNYVVWFCGMRFRFAISEFVEKIPIHENLQIRIWSKEHFDSIKLDSWNKHKVERVG